MRKTVWVLLVLVGCGGDNSLGGSVSALFPLDVSQVEILRNEEAIQLSYYNNNGPDIDLVARVTVEVGDLDFHSGVKVPLEGEYAPGHPRTTVGHQRAGEPERYFGTVHRGILSLDLGGEPTQPTRGSFSMLFDTGSDYGAGRDITGNFAGVAKDAGFDPIVPDAGP